MKTQLTLIGDVTVEFLKSHLSTEGRQEEGVARFLLHLLSGEQVAHICKSIMEDPWLSKYIEIKVPRTLMRGIDITETVLTDEKTTYWRNASCSKPAILLANTNDDQGQSLNDITRIGAKELKGQYDTWVEVASRDLPLTDDQKSYWKQALKGLQSVSECSLEQFSAYVNMAQEKIDKDGVPVVTALGWALPALRIPRDSFYFDSIPATALGHASRWKKKFVDAFSKRACYLYKHHPNNQIISNKDLENAFEKIKDLLKPEVQNIIRDFMEFQGSWSTFTERFAELEWEEDQVNQLFFDLKPLKINIAEQTKRFFEDEFPDSLNEEEQLYVDNLVELFKKKKTREATEEDKEFYDNHKQEFEEVRELKATWDKFIYGKPIECSDFLVGLLEALERLSSQTEFEVQNKHFKIRTQKGNRKSSWASLNQDIAMYFCHAYKGLPQLTSSRVEWDTHYLFKYDELVEEWKNGGSKNKKMTSIAKSAIQIVFYIEFSYEDLQGRIQKNEIQLIWHGQPLAIGLELHKDLKRLVENPFSYSTVTQNPVSKKGKLQGLSLEDTATLQAVFGQDRGSLVSTYSKAEDLQKLILGNLKEGLKVGRLSPSVHDLLRQAWEDFSYKYTLAIKDLFEKGASAETIIEQGYLYERLLHAVLYHAKGDINRKEILQPILSLGNVKIEGERDKAISIIAPWHPLRMVAKAVKSKQVIDLLNYVLETKQVDFGDSGLFFADLKEELSHPYYPEVTVGYKGQMPILIAESDTKNEYSLMENPIQELHAVQTNEDPKDASRRLLHLVERYLDLQPHEKANLSVMLYNCDSARLPEAIVESLAALQENEEEARCQVILKHRDNEKLSSVYSKLIESNESDSDTLAASEVTRDFMARLRIGVMAQDTNMVSSNKQGNKVADIVFLQDVISRQASVEWEKVNVRSIPTLDEHYPPRWTRRRSTTRDELKSTVYLSCPSQPAIAWTYLSAIYSLIKGVDVQANEYFLPARQISFRDEETAAIFSEAHKLGEWVVNYDELLERRQLKSLGVNVIKYQHNRTRGANVVVSSTSQLNLLKVLVSRRLKSLALNLDDREINAITERFINDANNISGDIVLRAAKQGVFAGELIGIVLSKWILQSEMENEASTGWFFLDDYASWLGKKEEQIADILAISPRYIEGEVHLQIFVSEAKYIVADGLSESRKNSGKQLRDTIFRIDDAIFGDPGRLDRDLWLSRLSDMLNDGIELPVDSPFSIEELREGLREGSIPIELKGYSHVFLSTDLENTKLDSERVILPKVKNSYQEVFTREAVRELILAYYHNDSPLQIRERLDDSQPWNKAQYNLPAARLKFSSLKKLNIDDIGMESKVILENTVTITNNQLDKMIEVIPKTHIEKSEIFRKNLEIDKVDKKHEIEIKDVQQANNIESSISWASPKLAEWIEKNTDNQQSSGEDQEWVTGTVNKLRMALMSYQLQAKVVSHRLTPNAVIIRLKGSDQLKVEDIEKRRSIILTTHALEIINVMAYPGEIVVSIARPQRKSVSLTEVWKTRKVQNNASGLNMSYVIGIKEMDGEILYLNLGSEFEGGAQHAPHTLIAGATGSGKSVLLQNLILDICVTNSKDLAQVYLIDPKFGVDYMQLADLPHLVEGIIDDQNRASEVLEQLVNEMNDRYQKFKELKVSNLKSYNEKVEPSNRMPLIFLIHDEFADWMLVEEYKNAVSSSVQRLGVKARAAGIHLIFAAQRPDANVLPVQLRDNLGNRLILRVESVGTSEISLGEKGAEKLLGKGHLIAKLQGESNLIYSQVPFLSEKNLNDISSFLNINEQGGTM